MKLKIHDSKLEAVKRMKYLGLQMNCFLDWKEHAMEASKIRNLFLRKSFCKISSQVLWSPIFDAAILFVVALSQLDLISSVVVFQLLII